MGSHLRKLSLRLYGEGGFRWVVQLVTACFHTLECLEVEYPRHGTSIVFLPLSCSFPDHPSIETPSELDLSKATKLKDIVFLCSLSGSEWIIAALRTITSNHRDLRQIAIQVPPASRAVTLGKRIPVYDGRTSIASWCSYAKYTRSV